MTNTIEKKLIFEFLEQYKNLPILWNSCHPLYSNKMARNRALSVLQETYKKIDGLADQRQMKRKLENMRTTYKRERCKVIKSQLAGGELYEPSLWYYSYMTFLDGLNDPKVQSDENANAAADGDDDDNTRSESPPAAKRPKTSTVYLPESEDEYETKQKCESAKKTKKTTVYLSDDNNIYLEEQDPSLSIKDEPNEEYTGQSTESDLYAKTIAAQLKELRPKQRYIAEKLISDVIFFGRLDKLKTGTSLNLNSDCF